MGRDRRAYCALLAIATATWLALAPAAVAEAPQASFTATPNPAQPGETVTFDGSGSSDPDGGSIANYRWDLDGNGSFETDTGTQATTSMSYGGAVVLQVGLRVEDETTEFGTTTLTLTINSLPTAGFIFEPDSPLVGQEVTFASTSHDPDGDATIATYAWDFGDGGFASGPGSSTTHVYTTTGTRDVTLEVTDDKGATAGATREITVQGSSSGGGGTTGGGSAIPPSSQSTPPVVAASPSPAPAPALLSPFPVIRIIGTLTRTGARITRFAVRAPSGARISILCRGRGCPYRRASRTARARVLRIRRLQRRLRAGTVIQIFVTKPGTIGKHTRLRIRRGRPPVRLDRCVKPGSKRPSRCPSS